MDDNKVLIVEDEAIIAADLANKIKQMDFDVIGSVGDVEEALDIVMDVCPNIVLMDINLGDVSSGIRFAKVIQIICNKMPVIFISGLSQPEELKHANLTGPYSFISKPFDPEEFTLKVEEMLNLR